MKPVSIIIPTYCPDAEVVGHLWKCMRRLLQNTNPKLYELIIIEQGDPHCIAFPAPRELKSTYIHHQDPLGYAKAVNIGLKLAITEYVCILNNDVFVPAGWLEQMLNDFKSIENCGVIAPFEGTAEPGKIITDAHWWSCVLLNRERFYRATFGNFLDEEKMNMRFHDQKANIQLRQFGYQVCRTGNVAVEHVNSATYSKMKVDETPERAAMMAEFGCLEFEEWVRNRPSLMEWMHIRSQN